MFSFVLSYSYQPLSLDTSRVTDMAYMFLSASSFNQPLSFDTSSVTNMDGMFEVRSAPYPQPPQSGPPSALLASPPLLHARPSPSPHVALLLCLPSYSAGHTRVVRREQAPHPLCVVGQCRVCQQYALWGVELFGRVLAAATAAAAAAVAITDTRLSRRRRRRRRRC